MEGEAAAMENKDQLELHQQQQLQLNYIEETVLKKRKSSEEWALRRKQQLLEKKWQLKQDKKLAFKRAEDFIKEYRSKELDFVNMKHRSKRSRTEAVSSGSKLLFVIRIKGKNDIHPQVKKTLNYLGLRRLFSGVFLKASEENLARLQIVEPFVTYGYPNVQNVKALIHKKGLLKVEDQKVPLHDNNVIEQALGKYDVLCIQDIIHEIVTVGPNFKRVASSLYPFALIKPQEDDIIQGKLNQFKKGGDSGDRGDSINELIEKMNA